MPAARMHREVEVARVGTQERSAPWDSVIVEEPLEIRIATEPFAVTMRTPGHDRELVLGFLWSEGVISSLGDVGSISPCGRPGDGDHANTINVTPAPGARLGLDSGGAGTRSTVSISACGVCGRRSIEDLLARCAPVTPATVERAAIAHALAALARSQPAFASTGGCHGAALVTLGGEHIATFEDVGRHNAVDKLVGAELLAGRLPLADRMLVVSGRTSFEVIQKAVAAGIPVVIGISAPTSLSIDLARRSGVTLLGFARDEACAVYAGTVA